MVSVVIPLYNKENTVVRALRSVLNQAYRDLEIIVVDDGSTDKSVEAARRLNDSRIRIVRQRNAGVSAARNRGIQEASSETIAFLDADDEWKPWFTETVSSLRNNFPDAGVWATNYEFALTGGIRLPTRLNGLPGTDRQSLIPDYFLLAARSHPPLNSSSTSVARKAITSIGGFPVGVRTGEDLLTWARLAARFPIAYSSEVCSTFWVTKSETSPLAAPSRQPETRDVVGQELRKPEAVLDGRGRRSLRLYIARWTRMRASMFARCGKIGPAVQSSFQAFRLNPREPVVWGFVGLALLHWCLRRLPRAKASENKR